VVSAEVLQEKTSILTVTDRGFGKRTRVDEYPIHRRGGKGVISIKTGERTGQAVGYVQVHDDNEVVLVTNKGKVIRTKAESISVMGRNTQGVKLMDVEDEDSVVSIGRVADKERSIADEDSGGKG
jgi:DNA gyrase subunit A